MHSDSFKASANKFTKLDGWIKMLSNLKISQVKLREKAIRFISHQCNENTNLSLQYKIGICIFQKTFWINIFNYYLLINK